MNDLIEAGSDEPVQRSELPSELPASADAPAQSDDLDSLLAEFEARTRPAEPAADSIGAQPDGSQAGDDLEKLIADLGGPNPYDQRANALQGEIDSLRVA